VNVLVIAEDATYDQHLLLPILRALLAQVGKPRAKVGIYPGVMFPGRRIQGIDAVLRRDLIEAIVSEYRSTVDLFLLCVDRDGEPGRRVALDALEEFARTLLPPGKHFVAVNAWQEVEVWVLAGHKLPRTWRWNEVRAERDPKERYFLPFAETRGFGDAPDRGASKLAAEAARRYRRIRRLCPEDIGALEDRLRKLLNP
jgi:hypothetical protein